MEKIRPNFRTYTYKEKSSGSTVQITQIKKRNFTQEQNIIAPNRVDTNTTIKFIRAAWDILIPADNKIIKFPIS